MCIFKIVLSFHLNLFLSPGHSFELLYKNNVTGGYSTALSIKYKAFIIYGIGMVRSYFV